MPRGATESPDRDRLLRIIAVYVDCDEEPNADAVIKQFRYETGRKPAFDSRLMDRMRAGCILVRKRLKARRLTSS